MPAYGDLVIIVTPKGKRSLRRVDENQDMHTQDGILRMADVVEAPFGSEVCTTLGVPYRIQKPTLNDIVKGVTGCCTDKPSVRQWPGKPGVQYLPSAEQMEQRMPRQYLPE